MKRFQNLVVLLSWLTVSSLRAATFLVTSTNDSGSGTLRQAILDANALAGTDRIHFSLTRPGLTISVATPLPAILDPLIVDGTTQPGVGTEPVVELNGRSAGPGAIGLQLRSGGGQVRGLIITRFSRDGILISGPGSNGIYGCFIGVDAAGTPDIGNGLNGINITNSPGNILGGASATERNLISGNKQHGILIQAAASAGNQILGNVIGLKLSGSRRVDNGGNGVMVMSAPSNHIGGILEGHRNVISGNSQSGIRIEGATSTGNRVIGNLIGTDPAGLVDIGNLQQGVLLLNAPANEVGSAEAGGGNLISGNKQAGVRIEGAGSQMNRVFGNAIGLALDGVSALGNAFEGINLLNNASSNHLGGVNPGEANRVAFNGADGLWLQSGSNNVARGNSIHSNLGLGIDLGPDGKLNNDAGDGDVGANFLQNYPQILVASNSAAGLWVAGTLNSRSNTVYLIDFYSNAQSDPSTNGEAQFYLGSTSVSTGPDGNASFGLLLQVARGRWISASATDPNGNTSEFSPCRRAVSTLPPSILTVTTTSSTGNGSLRQAILDNNLVVAEGPGEIRFAIPGTGPFKISPNTPLPLLIEPALIDGFSQPGARPDGPSPGNDAVILIQIDGAAAASGVDGFRLVTPGNRLRGLSITRFSGDGVEIATNGNQVVEGCFIGLDPDGVTTAGNSQNGIHVNGTSGNRLGGDQTGQGNLISGNGLHGILIFGGGAQLNQVLGNQVGTDRSGTLERGNNQDGVNINNAPKNLIGGAGSGASNLLSGNRGDGVELAGNGTTNTVIQGNRIGVDEAGEQSLGNAQNGIAVTGNARINSIGGLEPGAGNRIGFNGAAGINLASGTNNAVIANSIHSNAGLGIDVGPSGITANDPSDGDVGANQLQNYPLITSATLRSGVTAVSGILKSRPSTPYQVSVYASQSCDPSGNGEGRQFLGVLSVNTDVTGSSLFEGQLSAEATGRYLTCTATDPAGNTSEFSPCARAESTLPSVILTVVNTNDSGAGSLRQALLDVGSSLGAETGIRFNIPGDGVHTIAPQSPFPTPAEPVTIDGYSQPGAAPNTDPAGFNASVRIRIDFAGQGGFGADGFQIRAGGTTLRGLALLRVIGGEGVDFGDKGGNTLSGCLVGVDVDGTVRSVRSTGVFVTSAGNHIGGLNPADRNVISLNWAAGIGIWGDTASNNWVQGNFIGTDLKGTATRGNFGAGIHINGAGWNRVGAGGASGRNIIGGNQTGVVLSETAHDNVVAGNFIGTDVTGNAALPNTSGGVGLFVGAFRNQIGGAGPQDGNLISGNQGIGLLVQQGVANDILGNRIGVSAAGLSLSNQGAGLVLTFNSDSNRVGGTLSREGNWIAYNGDAGVIVVSGSGNRIRANRIHGNAQHFGFRPGLGIDLGENGIDANDPGDGDDGPNRVQNHPVIESATRSASATTLRGILHSAASQTYEVDFFANILCDPSGSGEGQFYMGSRPVTTDPAGNAVFEFTLPVTAPGRYFTATATSPLGDTSEFSPCHSGIIENPPAAFDVTTSADVGPGSLREAIARSNAHLSSSRNTIRFMLPGGAPRVIAPASPLPAFSQPVSLIGPLEPGPNGSVMFGGNGLEPAVELNGRNALPGQDGLVLNIPDLEVRGLRIVGFPGSGILCLSSNALIAGNLIQSNSSAGIRLVDAAANQIGGALFGEANLICANNGTYGIEIQGAPSRRNRILGNFLGVGFDGVSPFGGQFMGVSITGGEDNLVGGPLPGQGNTVAHHSSAGVHVQYGSGNAIRGNSLFNNGNGGIDLGFVGPDINDPNDVDEGPNGLQNYPVLTIVEARASETRFVGTLNSTPGTVFQLDFFANPGCGFAGAGEGRYFLGTAPVTTDSMGVSLFDITLPRSIPARFLSATATGPEGSSELSACIEPSLIEIPGSVHEVTTDADSGPGSLRFAIQSALQQPNMGRETIHFNIPGPGVHVISLLSSLPNITEPMDINGFTQTFGPAFGSSLTGSLDRLISVQLDGHQASGGGAGLRILSTGVVVRGLSLTRFPGPGVLLELPDNSPPSGLAGNVISGNLLGLPPLPVEGAGLADWGNGSAGVLVRSPHNLVGESAFGPGNVISANQNAGLVVSGANSLGTVIRGNLIGTDPLGISTIGNAKQGVFIAGSPDTQILGNTIGGNKSFGLEISDPSPLAHVLQGNFIGTDSTRARNLGNGADGIYVRSGSGVLIGGGGPGQGNVVGFNQGAGVRIDTGNRNTILGNSLFNNVQSPIALGFSANDQVKAPTIESSTVSGNQLHLTGRFLAPPNTATKMDVFVAPPGFSGLVNPVGSFTFPTGPDGTAVFDQFVLLPPSVDAAPGSRVAMTMTLANGSSSAASVDSVIVKPGTIDLVSDKVAEPPVIDEGTFPGFLLRVVNKGPATATNVRLTDLLPAGMSHLSSTLPADGSVVDLKDGGDRVTYIIPSLPPGKVVEIAMGLAEAEPGVYLNRLVAQADQPDNAESNNTATATLVIRGANPGLASEAPATAANTTQARSVNDPISTYSGELYELLPPDLALGGSSMPLGFQRFYGSRLQREGRLPGTLGENWTHNFEARLQKRVNRIDVTLFPGVTLSFTNDAGTFRLLDHPDFRHQLRVQGSGHVLLDPRNSSQYRFDAQGRLEQLVDISGNAQQLEYSGDKLLRVSDGLGRTLTFAYSAQGQLTNLTDGIRTVAFTQTNGQLASVRQTDGSLTSYAYTSSGTNGALLTSTTRPVGNRPFSQTFNPRGQVSSQTMGAPGSNPTVLTYSGTVTEARDPLFQSTVDTYDGSGRLLSITDPMGKSIRFEYDASGRIVQLQDRLGNATRSSYHPPSGRLLSITNPDGGVTRFEFQPRQSPAGLHHDLVRTIHADGTSRRFEYDSQGRLIRRADRLGQALLLSYNNRGQLTGITNPAGGFVRYTYNADGTRASVEDSDRDPTRFYYDALKRLIRIEHPDGAAIQMAYDAGDRLVSITDERGGSHRFDYDANGNLLRSINALLGTNAMTYDVMDRVVFSQNALGRQTAYTYEPNGRVASIVDPGGVSTFFQYGLNGQLTRIQNSSGELSTFTHDAEGRWLTMTNARGFGVARSLDALGNEVERRTEVGGLIRRSLDTERRLIAQSDSLNRILGYAWDAESRLIAVTNPGAGTARYTRNPLGLVDSITGANGEVWRMAYSPMGRLLRQIDPLQRTNRYSTDRRGRLSEIRFADGASQTNTFDPSGNVVQRAFSDGTRVDISLDLLNRPVQVGDLALGYSAASQVTNTSRAGVSYGATYDAGGRLSTASYHNSAMVVTYSYGTKDRLSRVRDSLTGTQLDFIYDAAGRLTEITRSSGLRSLFSYDAADRVVRIQEGNVIDLRYQLDVAGQVVRQEHTLPLDPASLPFPAEGQWTYDSAHQISNAGYSYDARGRMVRSPSWNLTWDDRSRLRSANGVNFEYDALGHLVRRTEQGTSTGYHYNLAIGHSPIMAETSENGAVLRYYVWSPEGRLLYLVEPAQGNRVRHFHFDRTGSTLALSDSSGAVTDAYAYSPYGELLGRTGTHPQPFLFVGAYGVRSETRLGLCQMRHRYYDPHTARFLSRDPVWPALARVPSLNPYQYAFEDPLNYLDPQGLDVEFMHEKSIGTPTGRQWNGLNLYTVSEEEMQYELARMRQLFQNVEEVDRYKFDSGLIGWTVRAMGALSPCVVSQWDSHFFQRQTDAFKFRGRIYNYGELNQYFFGQWGMDAGLPPEVIELGLFIWKVPVYTRENIRAGRYELATPSLSDVNAVYLGWADAKSGDLGYVPKSRISQQFADEHAITPRVVKAVVSTVLEYAPEIIQANHALSEAGQCIGDLYDSGVSILGGLGETLFGGGGQ